MTERPLESELERKGNGFAELRGWWTCKFTSPGLRGVPDRIYSRVENGRPRVVFIEWKRPGETPTKQQLRRHQEMREHGLEVHWVDSYERACEILQ